MRRLPEPSKAALRRAYKLGLTLGGASNLDAIADIAKAVDGFDEFVLDCQRRLEDTRAFSRWERRLQRLAESEGRRLHFDLDDHRYWDALYVNLLDPLKESFWRGWEDRLEVEQVFESVHRNAPRSAAPAILRVAGMIGTIVLPEPVSSDEAGQGMAGAMFGDDSIERDEGFAGVPFAGLLEPSDSGQGVAYS